MREGVGYFDVSGSLRCRRFYEPHYRGRLTGSGYEGAIKLAAVIPAFNSAQTLERAVGSVLDQTYPISEILVVDDGSSDETFSVATRMAADDRRIRVLRRDQPSGGPAAPRNLAIRAAKAEWIAFLDADDEWLPHKTASQLPHLANADVIYSNTLEGGPMGWRPWNVTPIPPQEPLAVLAYSDPIPVLTVIARRRTLVEVDGFDESPSLAGADDWHLWLKIALRGGTFVGLDQALARYHRTTASMTSDLQMHFKRELAVLEALRRQYPEVEHLARGLEQLPQRQAMLRLRSVRSPETPPVESIRLLVQALRDDRSPRTLRVAAASLARRTAVQFGSRRRRLRISRADGAADNRPA